MFVLIAEEVCFEQGLSSLPFAVILMRLMGVAALEALPPSRIRKRFLTLAFLVPLPGLVPFGIHLQPSSKAERADARSTNEIVGPDTRTQTYP